MKSYKPPKPFKKMPYLVIAPIVSIIAEIVMLFFTLYAMDSLSFNKQNMLGVKQVLIVGVILFVIYGVIELLVMKNREAKWYVYPAGSMFIPLIVLIILFLVTLTHWWGNRTSEHAEFFMYLSGALFVYLAVASIFRVIAHIIFWIFDNDTPQRRAKRQERAAKKKAKNDKKNRKAE